MEMGITMANNKKAFTYSKKQLEALSLDKVNMLVSAGAGSGKTAVLTERIYRMITEANVPLDSILVLTFSDLGAQEFRERIKKKLSEDPKEAQKAFGVDKADIMTFDAYALKLLKKYGYRLNYSSQIINIDDITEKTFIRQIFNELMLKEYEKPSPEFKNLAKRLLYKDDELLLNIILELLRAANLTLDPQKYLDTFIINFYSNDNFQKMINELDRHVVSLLRSIYSSAKLLNDPRHVQKYDQFGESVGSILTFEDYLSRRDDFKIPTRPKNSFLDYPEDELIKAQIDKYVKELNTVSSLSSKEEIYRNFLNEAEYAKYLTLLSSQILSRLNEKKAKLHAFTFSDVARSAYQLISIPDIQQELKSQYEYILVDEYQDTSDIQEEFVNKIADNNLYMVGDIKQSIYGFRNANVYIFKEKYAKYKDKKGGRLIDLNDNYRSRNEVLTAINNMLSLIMTENHGGANYEKEHQIGYGNKAYDSNFAKDQEVGLKVIKYTTDLPIEDDELEETSSPIERNAIDVEAQIVIDDIKKRIENHEEIYDADLKVMRPLTYRDFAILVSRKTNFDKFEKAFLNAGIPLFLDDDKTEIDEKVFVALTSVLKLFVAYSKESSPQDYSFRFEVASFLRSFVNNYSDQALLDLIGNKNRDFSDDPVLQKIADLASSMHNEPVMVIVNKLVETFDLFGAIYHLGDVAQNTIKLTAKLSQIESLAELGFSLEEIVNYFEENSENTKDIAIRKAKLVDDAVLIMTIHRSKGLEFPIVYYVDLEQDFYFQENRNKNSIYPGYGITFANINDVTSINEILSKEAKKREILSERIRLLYVALTRARELMVVIHREDDKNSHFSALEEQKTFKNILLQSPLFREVSTSLNPLLPSPKEGTSIPKYRGNNKITLSKHSHQFTTISNKISRHEGEKVNEHILRKGTLLHRELELYDFDSKKLDYIVLKEHRETIKQIVESPLFNGATTENVYREYSFIDEATNKTYTIDFFILGTRKITLIDFKLLNIDIAEYDEQVLRYAKHLQKVFARPVEGYLYSILKQQYRKVVTNE